MSIPGPKLGYPDLIDMALLNRQAEPSKDSRFPLRPSAAGYCARRLAYDLMQHRGFASYAPEEKEPNVLRLLSLGSSIEWHSIRNFELIPTIEPKLRVKYKQQCVTMFRLDPTGDEEQGQLIEGSIDLAVMHVTASGGIGDVKSAKDKFSQAYKTYWDESLAKFNNMASLKKISEMAWYAPKLVPFLKELNDPFFEDNFHQLNAYACTEWAKEHGVDHGFIYRYCKNDSRHLEIRFKPDQGLFDAFRDKCERVSKAVAKKQPEEVARDYVLGSMKCAFCPRSKECWGDEDTLRAWFATFPERNWPKRVKELKSARDLETQMATLSKLAKAKADYTTLEMEMVKTLVEQKVNKVKFANGEVYELKYLKSPRAHFELRRSK